VVLPRTIETAISFRIMSERMVCATSFLLALISTTPQMLGQPKGERKEQNS
jgi:hypothetical protein